MVHPALRDKSKIFLRPLTVKLSLIKISVKAMDKENKEPAYLRQIFPKTVEANMKGGIFVSPQITPIRRTKL